MLVSKYALNYQFPRTGKSESSPITLATRKFRNPAHKNFFRTALASTQKAYNEQWEWNDKCRRRQRNLGMDWKLI